MEIYISGSPRRVTAGDFHYGNIESRYGVNTQYFTRDGEPYMVIAGEMHFSRTPRARWRETILKMRDCGINTVATYVFWNYHEENKGVFDFSGNKDIAAFLRICREVDMPCLLRIGPWCHGEVIRGGFPKRIQKMLKKRCDDPKYLSEVREYWSGLYKEVAPFMDGKTVIGIQLENEYTGSTEHIRTLRKIAEEIGFKTPFFTMTAWPSGYPDRDFLPMMGGYPDGPWNMGKKALKPNNRFAITPAKTENEIGADLHKNNQTSHHVYDDVPYAACETGPGNQVTQHRRPYISEKDGYGVGFAKFASGMNWLGYYMFCGGQNPHDRLMQENRLTGYPNNYPIVDYDFQAPISRYGVCRAHGDRLRLLRGSRRLGRVALGRVGRLRGVALLRRVALGRVSPLRGVRWLLVPLRLLCPPGLRRPDHADLAHLEVRLGAVLAGLLVLPAVVREASPQEQQGALHDVAGLVVLLTVVPVLAVEELGRALPGLAVVVRAVDGEARDELTALR